MAYCYDRGIPHSEFLDRWGDDDRIKVIAHRLRENGRCGSCGTFPSEWLDEDGRVLHEAPYVAELMACQGCREIAALQEEADKAQDPGVRVVLKVPETFSKKSEESG